MAAPLREDATMHRFWYDLRNQSLFDQAFRSDVCEIDQSLERMIWRIVSRFADLAGVPADGQLQRGLRSVRRAVPARTDQPPGGLGRCRP